VKNNPADTKVSEEGVGGDAPRAEEKIPLHPVEKFMVKQAVPLQPMDVHHGARGLPWSKMSAME